VDDFEHNQRLFSAVNCVTDSSASDGPARASSVLIVGFSRLSIPIRRQRRQRRISGS
jgi:hypothetical protein